MEISGGVYNLELAHQHKSKLLKLSLPPDTRKHPETATRRAHTKRLRERQSPDRETTRFLEDIQDLTEGILDLVKDVRSFASPRIREAIRDSQLTESLQQAIKSIDDMGSEAGKIGVIQGMNVDEEGHYPVRDLEAAEALGRPTPRQGQIPEHDGTGIYTQAETSTRQPTTVEASEPFDELINLCVLERQHPREAPIMLEECPHEHWICPSDQVKPLLGTDKDTLPPHGFLLREEDGPEKDIGMCGTYCWVTRDNAALVVRPELATEGLPVQGRDVHQIMCNTRAAHFQLHGYTGLTEKRAKDIRSQASRMLIEQLRERPGFIGSDLKQLKRDLKTDIRTAIRFKIDPHKVLSETEVQLVRMKVMRKLKDLQIGGWNRIRETLASQPSFFTERLAQPPFYHKVQNPGDYQNPDTILICGGEFLEERALRDMAEICQQYANYASFMQWTHSNPRDYWEYSQHTKVKDIILTAHCPPLINWEHGPPGPEEHLSQLHWTMGEKTIPTNPAITQHDLDDDQWVDDRSDLEMRIVDIYYVHTRSGAKNYKQGDLQRYHLQARRSARETVRILAGDPKEIRDEASALEYWRHTKVTNNPQRRDQWRDKLPFGVYIVVRDKLYSLTAAQTLSTRDLVQGDTLTVAVIHKTMIRTSDPGFGGNEKRTHLPPLWDTQKALINLLSGNTDSFGPNRKAGIPTYYGETKGIPFVHHGPLGQPRSVIALKHEAFSKVPTYAL